MKKISIIIVNYNGERFLERLFKSVEHQTFRDFEIIFVDNGSRDSSLNYVKNNFSEVKTIPSINKGYGAGCNIGAKFAQGEYLIFLNEDMYLPGDFLEKMIRFRNKLPSEKNIGAISCKMVDFDAEPNNFEPTYGAKIDILGFPVRAKNANETFIVSGSPTFIRRELFLNIGGFNEAIFIYGEDVDLSWRLNIFGFQNFTINSTYLYHVGGGATGTLGPKKISNVVYGAFVPIFTNYNPIMLLFVFPVFLISTICFFIVLSIVKLSFDYFREIFNRLKFFLTNIKKALSMRHFVQTHRKRSDLYLIKYISLVPAFIANKSVKKLNKNYTIKNY
jgi:GT2 family glycosyltransferase